MLKYKRIFFAFSGFLVAASIASLILFGLNFGIDFTGGSLLEIKTDGEQIAIENILESEKNLNLGDVRVQRTEEGSFLIRMRDVSQEEYEKILEILKASDAASTDNGIETGIKELRFESIGPVIGSELKQKAVWQIFLVVAGITLYIAFAFRKVSKLKEKSKISWKFGISALVALIHDVTITTGVFAILGKFLKVEIDSSFVAAILLVLGYSVNDTIVVFDRIRENLIHHKYSLNLEHIINSSIRQTLMRSINTSLTVLLVLFSLLIFGSASIFYFTLALTIGIAVGTYSSIFIASALLYEWEK
ncbi:MAG: protein translocase subunit SecF [Patescibacteria group bacterium]